MDPSHRGQHCCRHHFDFCRPHKVPAEQDTGLGAAADHAGHWAAGHTQVPGQVPAGIAVGLGQQLQLSPGLCYLPGGVHRGPGTADHLVLPRVSPGVC